MLSYLLGATILAAVTRIDASVMMTISSEPWPLTATEKNNLLNMHNFYRCEKGLGLLEWDVRLEAVAYDYSTTCRSVNLIHNKNRTYQYHVLGGNATVLVGENVVSCHENDFTFEEIADMWIQERQWWNCENNQCEVGKKCGHYTTALYYDILSVGCAAAKCTMDDGYAWKTLVCNYEGIQFAGYHPFCGEEPLNETCATCSLQVEGCESQRNLTRSFPTFVRSSVVPVNRDSSDEKESADATSSASGYIIAIGIVAAVAVITCLVLAFVLLRRRSDGHNRQAMFGKGSSSGSRTHSKGRTRANSSSIKMSRVSMQAVAHPYNAPGQVADRNVHAYPLSTHPTTPLAKFI